MTSPGLPPGAAPSPLASGTHAGTWRQASVRQQAQQLAALQGFQREMAARTCVRLRRETRLQLQGMRRLLHALCE